MAQRGVNKVILLGNLGKDPEVKYMPNGNAVANITLATSETWNDKSSGEKQEKTEQEDEQTCENEVSLDKNSLKLICKKRKEIRWKRLWFYLNDCRYTNF